jgi:hypothetical protein
MLHCMGFLLSRSFRAAHLHPFLRFGYHRWLRRPSLRARPMATRWFGLANARPKRQSQPLYFRMIFFAKLAPTFADLAVGRRDQSHEAHGRAVAPPSGCRGIRFCRDSFPIPCASTILRRMGTLSFSHAAHAATGYVSEGNAAALSAYSAWHHPANGRKHGAAPRGGAPSKGPHLSCRNRRLARPASQGRARRL